MKYINAAAGQMLDESELVKSEIYKMLYRRDKQGIKEYTDRMMASASNQKPIQDLQTFVLGNWQERGRIVWSRYGFHFGK